MAATTAAESTVPGVSSVLTRGLAAQVNHAFRRWLIATGTFAFWLDDCEGSPRVDKRYAASALLTYKAAREFWLKAEYRHEWRTSNVPATITPPTWCSSGCDCSDEHYTDRNPWLRPARPLWTCTIRAMPKSGVARFTIGISTKSAIIIPAMKIRAGYDWRSRLVCAGG